MTDPVSDSVMSRVMKLLTLAADENATPAERALAEEHTERIMAQHAIDRFEAEQKAKANHTQVRKPVQQTWEVVMSAYKSENNDYRSDSEFDYQIIDMMKYVLEHCNVRVNDKFDYGFKEMPAEFGAPRRVTDPFKRVYKIVGYPEDIAYAERIWFNVFKTFVNNVNPQWDLNKSLEYNAYNFASAGVSWKQQVLLAEKAGDLRLEWPWRYQTVDPSKPNYTTWSYQAGEYIDPGNEPWGKSIHKLKRACKKYCTDQNFEYPYAPGVKLRVASRSAFARSYRSTISMRLREIRRKAQEGAEHVDANKFALALIDTKESVDAEFYRLFPEYDPEVRRKMKEAREFEEACMWASLSEAEKKKVLRDQEREEEMWQRAQERAERNYRRVRVPDSHTRVDNSAWLRGRAAAQSVNLSDNAEVKEETRKGIE
jgi:hypothetical protein